MLADALNGSVFRLHFRSLAQSVGIQETFLNRPVIFIALAVFNLAPAL